MRTIIIKVKNLTQEQIDNLYKLLTTDWKLRVTKQSHLGHTDSFLVRNIDQTHLQIIRKKLVATFEFNKMTTVSDPIKVF